MITFLESQNGSGKTPEITSVIYESGVGTSTIGKVTINIKNNGVKNTYYYIGTSPTPTAWTAISDSQRQAYQIDTNIYIKGTYYVWVMGVNGSVCKNPTVVNVTTTFLYSWGNQFTSITGGWKVGACQYSGAVTFNSNNIYLNGVNNEQGVATATVNKILDVTNYNTLSSYVYTASHPSPYEGGYDVCLHPNNSTLAILCQYRAGLITSQYIGKYATPTLDITSINGNLYPALGVLSQINTYTYQVYLQ